MEIMIFFCVVLVLMIAGYTATTAEVSHYAQLSKIVRPTTTNQLSQIVWLQRLKDGERSYGDQIVKLESLIARLRWIEEIEKHSDIINQMFESKMITKVDGGYVINSKDSNPLAQNLLGYITKTFSKESVMKAPCQYHIKMSELINLNKKNY